MKRVSIAPIFLFALSWGTEAASISIGAASENYYEAAFYIQQLDGPYTVEVNRFENPSVTRHDWIPGLGNIPLHPLNRNGYYSFDLSGIEGSISSATFSIFLGDAYFATETARSLSLYNYRTGARTDDAVLNSAIDAMNAGVVAPSPSSPSGSVQDYLNTFDCTAGFALRGGEIGCFGTGTRFGSVSVSSSDEGSWLEIALNAEGIAEAQARTGNVFAVYLALGLPDYSTEGCTQDSVDEQLWCTRAGIFDADTLGTATLQINTVVPIPAAAWLFGSALAGLGWLNRKQTA